MLLTYSNPYVIQPSGKSLRTWLERVVFWGEPRGPRMRVPGHLVAPDTVGVEAEAGDLLRFGRETYKFRIRSDGTPCGVPGVSGFALARPDGLLGNPMTEAHAFEIWTARHWLTPEVQAVPVWRPTSEAPGSANVVIDVRTAAEPEPRAYWYAPHHGSYLARNGGPAGRWMALRENCWQPENLPPGEYRLNLDMQRPSAALLSA